MAARLGAAAREAREAAGVRQIDIAIEARVDSTTVGRFERGERWAWNTDEIVEAYAHELGIRPIDLWRAALERHDD